MKNQNHKIVAIFLVIVTILSFILPSLTPQINASPEDSDYYIQKHIVTDNYTNNVNKNALSNGEVWVDKTVSTGPITIDGYDFETEEFIVQLSSIAKQVQESKEPADIVLLLDVTGSSSNPIKGYGYNKTSRNGSNSYLVMAVNEFIEIVMKSDSRNKIAVITYGGTNMYISGTNIRLGSEPMKVLLELGHYTNDNWNYDTTYIVTEGEGSIEEETYMGGKIVEGKYISFYESSWQNSVWDYIEDESLRSKTWFGNQRRYTFKVQSNENIKKDGTLYPKITSYTNWGGTGTQAAIYTGTKYLQEHVSSDTGILIVLTDGIPTVISPDYTTYTDYNSDEVTRKEYSLPEKNDGTGKWSQSLNTAEKSKAYESDDNAINNAIFTILGATHNKKQLEETYDNAYIYTVSVFESEYSDCVLNPSNFETATEEENILIYQYLEDIFKNNKELELQAGLKAKNILNTQNYQYSDGYYYVANKNIEELTSSFNDITSLISGNACGSIKFYDTIGDNMEIKNIKGLMVDGVLYTNFKQENNEYTIPELPGITVKIIYGRETTRIVYILPETYIESLVRLIFEVGVSSTYNYSNQQTHMFYSNNECYAEFTLSSNNTYNGFNKTVNKSQNKTNTAVYVSQSTKDDLEVTVNLGNNGLLTVNKLENKIDLKLTKIWSDNNNASGLRPNSIKINIFYGPQLVTTTTLTKAENMIDENTWEKTISLPKYTDQGEIIEYDIEEEEITLSNGDSYTPLINGTTITNVLTHNGKISITKIWEDDNNKYNTRPNSIEINILQNGQNYKTVTLTKENAVTGYSNIWQIGEIDAPAYNNSGSKNIYTIKENTNNSNLLSFYQEPIYDQNTLTVRNKAIWYPLEDNDISEYKIIIKKEILNKNNQIATSKDFEKIKLNINSIYEFPVKLLELEKTMSKEGNSMKETYGEYTGNIFSGIVTNKQDLIFSNIKPGKYEIYEEDTLYFNFVNFEEIELTDGAKLTKENNKYFITISGITGNYEEITVKLTNKLIDERPYNKLEDKDNLFKLIPVDTIIEVDPDSPEDPEPDPEPGEVLADKTVFTDKIVINDQSFYTKEFLIQLEAIIQQVHEDKEPVDIMIMLDSTGSTHNPIYGYGLDAEDRNGSQDDFIVAINEFIDIIMASNEKNRIGVICYGAYNRYFKDTSIRYGSEPMFTILELGHYTNPNWTESKPYIFTPGKGSIYDKTYEGGGTIQGKYISWFESARNQTVWDYLDDTSLSSTLKKQTWFSHRNGYNYKLQTNLNLKKDNTTYTQKNFYGGVAYTGTQNAILTGTEYLKENVKGKTGILILMTDGVPNVIRKNYANPVNVNNASSSKQYTVYNSSTKKWSTETATLGSNLVQVSSTDAAIATVVGAVYAKQQLLNSYENAYLFTISNMNTEYADCLLDPILYKTATTTKNKNIYKSLNSIFKENKTVTLDCGVKLTNNTGTTNYLYNDDYFYADDIDSLTNSLKIIFDTIKGNTCGDVVFTDTLGKDIVFKGIKGIFIDDVFYDNFVEKNNIYTCSQLRGITIELLENQGKQVIRYTLPSIYSNKHIKLIFEAGVREDFKYETETTYIFYSNDSCYVDFELTDNNPYTYYDKLIIKPENITNSFDYIYQGMNNNGKITISLGNNGIMIIEK